MKIIFLFFDFNSKNTNRQVLPAMLETKDLMHAWRIGAVIIKKAAHRGSANTEASEEAEVGAEASDPDTKEA